jgi:chromosomal replication initiator protein
MTAPVVVAADGKPAKIDVKLLGGSPLDARLTFETFAVGRSNTLAHAAAEPKPDSVEASEL